MSLSPLVVIQKSRKSFFTSGFVKIKFFLVLRRFGSYSFFIFSQWFFQDDSVTEHNGKYFSDCRVKEPVQLANNVKDQDLLDKLSRKLVGLEEK
jgi:hypothetical protein